MGEGNACWPTREPVAFCPRSPMKDVWKKLKGRCAVVSIVGLVLVGAAIWLSSSRQPSHAGRLLADWVRDLDARKRGASPARHSAASVAISEIGVNALPYLLREIAAKDSKTEEKLRDWAQSLRPVLEIGPYLSAGDRQFSRSRCISSVGRLCHPWG